MNKNVAFTIVQNIARVVAIIMVAFFFIPTFMVSCSGQEHHISAFEIVAGLQNSSGHEVLEPHPGYAVLFLFPIIVAIFWLVCSSGIANGVITLILDGINLLVWFVLKMQAEEYCREQYYEFECTGLYWINILMHILMFILCFYAIGTDAAKSVNVQSKKQENGQRQIESISTSTVVKSSKTCSNCGTDNSMENKYCSSCGASIYMPVVETYVQSDNVPEVKEGEKSGKKGFAIASLVLGIVSLLLSCILAVGPILSLGSITTGIISLVKEKARAMPIVAICLSVLAIVISILILIITVMSSGLINI